MFDYLLISHLDSDIQIIHLDSDVQLLIIFGYPFKFGYPTLLI